MSISKIVKIESPTDLFFSKEAEGGSIYQNVG